MGNEFTGMFHFKDRKVGSVIVGEASPLNPEAMDLMTSIINDGIATSSVEDEKISNSPQLLKDFGQSRNRVLLIRYKESIYVAKNFKRPIALSGFIKRWVSGSKASKAYRNACILMRNGFNTARPIIWWERVEKGRITDSWLITEYLDHHLIAEFRDPYHNKVQQQALMRALAAYMLRLHEAGFRPLDFNIGNLFYSATDNFFKGEDDITSDDITDFFIIDINRMKQGRVPGFSEAMKSFDQLGILPEEYPYLLYPYADARGWNREACVKEIMKLRQRNSIRKRLTHFK